MPLRFVARRAASGAARSLTRLRWLRSASYCVMNASLLSSGVWMSEHAGRCILGATFGR